MAHFYPSLAPRHALTAGAYAELALLETLERGLSDAYAVFHSVDWMQAIDGRELHGELDVVIVNQGGDVLILELKAGDVEFAPDGIFKTYSGQRKDVLRQVRRQHGALRARLAESGLHPIVHHLLVLPDFRVVAGSVQWPRERIVDASELPQLLTRIGQVLGVGAAPGCREAVMAFLSNRFRVEPDVSVLGGQLQQATARLASGLATWVPRLTVPHGVIRVCGTAGSGKTQLALRLLRDASAAGRRAAYLCFNRTLADHVVRIAPTRAQVETFHEYAVRFARQQGHALDLAQSGAFDVAVNALLKALPAVPPTLDLLVIDEMQDFQPEWVQALLSRLVASGQAVLLEDPCQQLYPDRDSFDIPDAVLLTSNENYRSPRGVVRLINLLALSEQAVEAMSPYEGDIPDPIVQDGSAGFEAPTIRAVRNCLARGFRLADIAIVSLRGRSADSLQSLDRLSDWRLQHFTGRFDEAGNAVWTQGDLRIDSVRRFKGQSAPAVVLTECDVPAMTALDRRLLFVGLTRARLHLEWVVSERTAAAIASTISQT
jgi:hypothetical protein